MMYRCTDCLDSKLTSCFKIPCHLPPICKIQCITPKVTINQHSIRIKRKKENCCNCPPWHNCHCHCNFYYEATFCAKVDYEVLYYDAQYCLHTLCFSRQIIDCITLPNDYDGCCPIQIIPCITNTDYKLGHDHAICICNTLTFTVVY